ncbi:MAG: hypothetical protein DRQ63_12005 [Gammaproteobacteria bacterium]|nr:MAG: hypothetical protein DRQ63_12005 [Gammaproteobacteria bacterium]
MSGGNFGVGTAPHSATFAGGIAETRGVPGFYADGINSWHISTSATITFETPVSTLSYFSRTVTDGDVSTIVFRDAAGAMIDMDVSPDANTPLLYSIDTAGGLPISSVDVTVTTGEIVIDLLTFGYAGFVESNGEIFCLVAETAEFVCVTSDGLGDVDASAQGMLQITNGTAVSGNGTLHALPLPGLTLGNGATVAALSISAGTVSEGATRGFTVDAAGGTATVAMTPDPDESYDRASALTTVAAVYASFDLFGDSSSLVIDDMGVISGASNELCVLSGQVSIIDATFNAYDVTLDLANCTGTRAGFDGTYNGLGFTGDDIGTDDVFIFIVFNADHTLGGEAKK